MKRRRETPSAGLVVRYDYLWRSEFLSKKIEGAKDRPCAVVVPMNVGDDGKHRVILAAITHSRPNASRAAIEIPIQAKIAIGLDNERSWIIVDEVNIVDWADAGFVPASSDAWAYGHLPRGFASKVIAAIVEGAKDGSLFRVTRD